MVNKIRISLHHTLCHVGVHFTELPPSVEGVAKSVDLCALCETVQLRRLGSTHWISGGTLWIRVVEPIQCHAKNNSIVMCTVL